MVIGREIGTLKTSEGVDNGIVVASAAGGGSTGIDVHAGTIGVGFPPSTGDGEEAVAK